jgi:hypothetical protein
MLAPSAPMWTAPALTYKPIDFQKIFAQAENQIAPAPVLSLASAPMRTSTTYTKPDGAGTSVGISVNVGTKTKSDGASNSTNAYDCISVMV